jgi:hypothetical protein
MILNADEQNTLLNGLQVAKERLAENAKELRKPEHGGVYDRVAEQFDRPRRPRNSWSPFRTQNTSTSGVYEEES